MSHHAITDLRLSTGYATRESTIDVAFTLKNLIVYDGKRRTSYIQFFRLCVDIGNTYPTGISDNVILGDDIAYGQSKTLTLGFKISAEESDALAAYFAANPSIRALPVKLEVSSAYESDFGGATVSDIFELPLTYLKSFCLPRIEDFSLERSVSGVPSDEGEDVLSTLKLSMNRNADTSAMRLRLHYAENARADAASPYVDLTAKIPDLLSGVTDSAELISRQFSNGSNWDFLLFFGDEYESSTAGQSFSRAFANLHLSGAKTGGACFGGFSSSEEGAPKLESYYPGYFYRGIHGVSIFSYQEVKTGGRWTDNKPLYTKVLALTDAAKGSLHSFDAPEDAETLWIDQSASFCVNSNGNVYPIGHVDGSGTRAFLAVYQPGTKKIVAATYLGATADFYIKIFYTKTTDEAFAPKQTHLSFTDSDGKTFMDANNLSFMTEV